MKILCLGWYYFFNSTPCKFPFRFITIISQYKGNADLDCDIARAVHVAHGLLCYNMEHAEVLRVCYFLKCNLGCSR